MERGGWRCRWEQGSVTAGVPRPQRVPEAAAGLEEQWLEQGSWEDGAHWWGL